ncbi:hypothetical protein ABZV14_37135 [Streptosporangium canum]|uniref:hypothetical protein n=1 Tax=Streptosporangium canum TaxID=324952 RepID=UPI0033BF283F
MNIRVVQEVLGHTRVTTTERYAHVSTPLMRDAENAWPRRSGGSPEPSLPLGLQLRRLWRSKRPSPKILGEGL